MSSDWTLTTVEDIAASRPAALATGPFGSSISAKYFADAGVPVIRGANLSADVAIRLSDEGLVFVSEAKAAEFQRSVAERGDLVFTCWGTINQVGLIDRSSRYNRYIISNKQMKLSVDPMKADSLFLYYLFSGPDKQAEILSNGIGSSVPGFNLGQLKKHELLLPPVSDQRRIAATLGLLDDRIALLRETNATLEAIAQALFKSWFVDFDPVRAKQLGLAPAGMDEATAALFPATDEEWQAQASRLAVSDMIASGALLIGDGYRAKNDELGQPGVPFVRAGDLDAGQITPTKDYLAEPAVKAAFTKMAKPGDTAFTSKGTIGRFAFVDDASGAAVYSPQVCFWRSLRTDIVEPAYLHYWMKSAAFKIQVDVVRGQAAIMDYVSLADQRRMRLDIPPIGVQKRFAEVGRVILEQISSNRAMATYLTSVRDALLPRLISGQLRLPKVEADADLFT